MLEKVLFIGLLYDHYGALLTDRQQECVRMYYLEDLSLSEIADVFSISRQAVHDILNRAEQTLSNYETKLKLVERHRCEQSELRRIRVLLQGLPGATRYLPQLIAIDNAISSLLTEERMAD